MIKSCYSYINEFNLTSHRLSHINMFYMYVGMYVYLPALRDGETIEDEVGEGFPESTLEWWCKSHDFTGNVP